MLLLGKPEMNTQENQSGLINPFEHEFTPSIVRAEIIDRLDTNRPIHFWGATNHGDNMIRAWAHYTVLRRLCESEGINPENINLRLIPEEDITDDIYDFTFRRMKLDKLYTRDSPTNNIWLKTLEDIAQTVDMALLPEDQLLVPEPLRLAHTALESFDRNLVIQEGYKIEQQAKRDGRKIVSIIHNGNMPEKRLSDDQIVVLAQAVKDVNPQIQVVIVSDKQFQPQEQKDESVFTSVADAVLSTRDINSICAQLYASDHIITTDGFWAWLAAGSKALREDRKGVLNPTDMLVLYTIADPDYWGIPGAQIVESGPLRRIKNVAELGWSATTGMIAAWEYHALHSSTKGIHEDDVYLLKNKIRELITP